MRLIFIDIDGPLNTEKHIVTQYNKHPKGMKEDMDSNFDPDAMYNLQRLTYDFGAYLVVSSSWRCTPQDFDLWQRNPSLVYIKDRHWKDMMMNFAEYGLISSVIGITPRILNNSEVYDRTGRWESERGDEIKLYLKKNQHLGIESFVIIDDDTDMGDLADTHLALCDELDGFNSRVTDIAMRILETQNMITFN